MRISVQFNQTNQKLAVKFNSNEKSFGMSFQALQPITARPEVIYYEGSYEVIPSVDAQTLKTKERFLTKDVQICEIPFFDVSNTSGGTTVYIGKEVEFYGS